MAESMEGKDLYGKGVADDAFVYEQVSDVGQRTVVVPKIDDAVDFTLQHLFVQPPASTRLVFQDCEPESTDLTAHPLGAEHSDASAPMETVYVKVKQDGKAHDAGLRTGDRIVSINGVNIAGKTYSQVIRLIHGSDSALTLMVIPKEQDVAQTSQRIAPSWEVGDAALSRHAGLISSCRVSMSPSPTRTGIDPYSCSSGVFSQRYPNTQEGNLVTSERISSGSPSLHIRVRLGTGPPQDRYGGDSYGGTSAAPSGREIPGGHWRTGSTFYPVTTTARMVRPETGIAEHETWSPFGTSGPNERYVEMRPTEDRNATSFGGEGLTSPVFGRTHLRNADALSPDDPLRQNSKMTSYQEITLSRLGERDRQASPLSPTEMVSPRASQPASCSSSHFIQMGGRGAGASPLLLNPGSAELVATNCASSPQRSPSSMVALRQQMFVSARPQSYESLFGQSPVRQTPPVTSALSGTASKSSSELVNVSSSADAKQVGTPVSRLSASADQPRINLVTERMRKFESMDSADGVRSSKTSKPWEDESIAKGNSAQFSYDSVAKRAAQFEQISTDDGVRRAEMPRLAGRRNVEAYRANTVGDQPKEPWSPSQPSFSPSSRQMPQSVTIPLYFRADPSLLNVRLTSPVTVRHEALSGSTPANGHGMETSVLTAGSNDMCSSEKKTGPYSSEAHRSAKVTMRQASSHQEKSGTEKAEGPCSMTVESFSQSTTLAMAATLGIKDQLFTGDTFNESSNNALNAPKSGNSNIKKFVSFFTDKAPKTEMSVDKKASTEPSLSTGNATLEGCLVCKAAVAEGKKASDRSWKPFWAILKGHFLCLYKDRQSVTSEEQSICVKSCSVEPAIDYVKKKNVFQITTASGSKFLLQAEDGESMSNWVKAIQANSEVKEAQMTGVTTALGQNIRQVPPPLEKTSPQVASKSKKQSSRATMPSKSPASPHSKSRKSEKEVQSPRGKEHRTWTGKMVKRFGRHRSGSGAAVENSDDAELVGQELSGTFGVPLYACTPSLINECLPLIVETCTRIVEERGIENQGIYRVPGNKCAVNTLRDELNKFPDSIDPDSEKWQDVNVVSSLLKLFFRTLPDSLITDELYEPVISAYRMQNPERKMLKLKKLLHELPEHNFETFRFLALHLNRVANREDINKMDAHNLAIVFGPTLVRPQDESVVLMVRDMSDQCRVVETIIVNVDWFFSSWDEDVNVPLVEENDPISSMNPELLKKAENMMNLTESGRDISAKDLVSSILHAANKKIRRKDKNKSAESIETEGESDISFSDRNADQDLDVQAMKEFHESGGRAALVSSVDSSSPTTPASPGFGSLSSGKLEESKPQTFKEARELKRYPAYHFDSVVAGAETENSKPKILRRYSEDAFGRSGSAEPEKAPLRHFVRDGSLVEQAEQQLRRLRLDAKALHHKQELEQQEREKRTSAKERIEREFNRTLQELELEEAEDEAGRSNRQTDEPGSAGEPGESDDKNSVRSAMDRCKLALYENRLRFFTDFGESKTFSPVFSRGAAAPVGSTSTTSVSSLTRRLSDQPRDSLRIEDDGFLRTTPVRAHSVSPSIIGREPRYNFDPRSETNNFTKEPSSSTSRVDRLLTSVSENQPSVEPSSYQPPVSQPLASSSSSVRGHSSTSGVATSFGSDSSTGRSSVSSVGGNAFDRSPKDLVFSEQISTESGLGLQVSSDLDLGEKVMRDDCVISENDGQIPHTSCEETAGNVREMPTIVEKPDFSEEDVKCATAGALTKGLQEEPSRPLGITGSSTGPIDNTSLLPTALAKATPGSCDMNTTPAEIKSSTDSSKNVAQVNVVTLSSEANRLADSNFSESHLTAVVNDSNLVNHQGANESTDPKANVLGPAQRDTSSLESKSNKSDLSASMLSSKGSIHEPIAFVCAVTSKDTAAAAAAVAGVSLPARSLPQTSENDLKDPIEPRTDRIDCERAAVETNKDHVFNGCTADLSVVTLVGGNALKMNNHGSEVGAENQSASDCVVKQSGVTLGAVVAKSPDPHVAVASHQSLEAADTSKTAIAPHPPSLFFRIPACLDSGDTEKPRQRHSVSGKSIKDLFPKETTAFGPSDAVSGRAESSGITKIRRAASLPLLPRS